MELNFICLNRRERYVICMDIMKAILDIEGKAQGVMNTLEDIREENDKKLQSEIEKIRDGMKKRADEKIGQHKSELEKRSKSDMTELEKVMNERKKALDDTFESNRGRWVKEITDAIVKDDSI